MSLSNTAEALEQHLIDGLNYKITPGGAAYVVGRASSTYFPSSGNDFSFSGVRSIRIPFTGEGWMDPQSAYLSFQVVNRDTTADTSTAAQRIELLSGVHSVFARVRILLGGQELESIDNYGRIVTQQLLLSPKIFVDTFCSKSLFFN